MAPRKGHCPCLKVPRMGHPRGGTCLPTDPSSLFLKEVLRRLLDTLPGLKVPHSPPGCLPPLLFLLTPHPSVGRALRHRGEGRLRTLPGPQSEAWVETDQKFIVKYVVHVSTDVATGQNSEPPQACLPTEPPSQVQGEVAGSPRRVRGGGAVGAAPLQAPVPTALRAGAVTGPTSWAGVGCPPGRESPSPAPQQPAARRLSCRSQAGSAGAHAEVGRAPSCASSRSWRSGPLRAAPSPRPLLRAQGAGQP